MASYSSLLANELVFSLLLILSIGIMFSTAQTTCNHGALRLVGGSRPTEGRVEVCLNSVWGTVCDDLWGAPDAAVVCRQLGYPTIGAQYLSKAYFGQGTGPIYLDNVNCVGSESSLLNCTHIINHNCIHSEDAGVACPIACPTEGNLRLVGGMHDHEGRVEICTSGVWSTVCDDFWGSLDAQVVCRQLGYSTDEVIAFSTAYFGQGYGPILLDNVHCIGSESSLLDCVHLNQSNCAHSGDAGVRCQVSNDSCLEGDVRLVGGQNQFEGRVEICFNSTWGTACSDTWSHADAVVLCRQLGYGTDNAYSLPSGYFGQGTGSVQIDQFACTGSESALLQCSHLTIDSCTYAQNAGVRCSQPVNNNCTGGDLRLVGGQVSNEGRVEVCLEGQWGTVCDDYWGSNDARVACRQLGYPSTNALSFSNANFGQGTGAIHLDDVQCSGSETSLLQCPHSSTHNCGHYEDAGLRCLESCSVEGAVRIVGGQSNNEGRVEYCSGGLWGSVCAHTWDVSDATVVCRELGYATTGVAEYNSYFLNSQGISIVSQVACNGNESKLNECTLSFSSYYCSSHAGVRCPEHCTTEGSLRLAGGTGDNEGRVEICGNGLWSFVCGTFWGPLDAQVVCRQLGYSTDEVLAFSAAYFGQGAGPILLHVVHCNGSETSLLDCNYLNQSNCVNNAEAGVRCSASNTSCLEGSLRLVNGQNQYEGRVEICLNSVWGTVCDDGWSSNDARVVCRQLRYGTAGSQAYSSAYFGQGTGPIQLDNVGCGGTESALIQCNHITNHNCGHYEDAGVWCGPPTVKCTDGGIRLVGGMVPNEGRVEVCIDSQWGTACDDYWDTSDTQVACKQLGYLSTGAVWYSSAYFGQGTGPIHLNSVHCSGTETSLFGCSLTNYAYCGHNEDVGIRCPESCSVDGAVRLVGGESGNEGRVEYCSGGVWGSVCDNTWDATDAAVVCRQLGYATTGIAPLFNANFGQGAGPVIINSVVCIGNETNINNCTLTTPSSCSHSNDAGVRCSEHCNNEGHLRLVGGQGNSSSQGTVQICIGGVWGTVCDDLWGVSDAQVVCRQLGYSTTGIQAFSSANFGQGSGPIQIDDVSCIGNETNLLNCTHSTIHNCTHNEDAGVVCSEFCSVEDNIRLVGGMNGYEGRVEVCASGVWSTVCDDFWGFLDAQVVCRQLGYSAERALALSTAYFGQGAGPILLDNVHCNGNESSLLDCNYHSQSNCAHSADAGVRCQASNTSCLEGDVRLVNGQNQYEGRVEICLNSVWGTVCDDSWSFTDARVVCRQLGYGTAGSQAYSYAYFGQGTGPIQLDNVGCSGTESALIQCNHITNHNCGHYEDAGVRCDAPTVSECTDGGIRLVGGMVPNEGRLEICIDGQWGTACDDYWDSSDTQVACRQLGYLSTGAVWYSSAYFGQGTGPIHLNSVHCSGTEASLFECPLTNYAYCGHYEDVGIRCPERCSDNGAVRLVGGDSGNEGRVEYCSGGMWGSVCDNTWDATDAAVVCRQLGYATTGIAPLYNANFGQGAGPVIINSVVCIGNETNINNCTLTTPSSCSHSNDAGVRCSEHCNNEGYLRLVGGQGNSSSQGTVQICIGGVWGTVCDDLWGVSDAQVVCRQLGYSTTGIQALGSANFGQGSGPIQIDDVSCIGNETNLLNCTHLTTHNYAHSEDAGVVCSEFCTVEDNVRLVGGMSEYEGRVEVCAGGTWGTVCDDFWGSLDAQVVCRQLGYSADGALAFSTAYFGQGAGLIILDNVHCNGSESSIMDCTHHYNQSNCAHSADAGVRCQGSGSGCLEGDVRLVNGQNQYEGRVEICLNNVWGTVCHDYWYTTDARVVCRQLGYGTDGAMAFNYAYFGQGSGPIQIDNVGCTGSESTLVQCYHITNHNCGHYEDAGVRCNPPGNCTDGNLRLTGGQSPNEGRVEVCLNGLWGTVCDDYWGSVDAQVACRQLGYLSSGAVSLSYAYFGQGTGAIHLDDVQCSGTETSLLQCSHSSTHNCGHYEDAGIRCPEYCDVEGTVRLVGGQSNNEGRVEYCLAGVWGSVCDNTWDASDAAVVCRQLGYNVTTGISPLYNANFGQGVGPVIINSIVCIGNETNINNCTLATPSTCSHYNDAGLRCSESCSNERELRLIGGQNSYQGTVQICIEGVWGTVCDDGWGIPDARVVCRQLGFGITGAMAHSYANFGQGSGPIQIDDVNCLGNESNLLNCTYDANNHHCGHSEDAGVTCSEPCEFQGSVRLVQGMDDHEGRVEVCTSGVWSTVCDDFWGSLDAQVVCRQLGYSTDRAVPFSSAYFGQGYGSILLDTVHCNGSESSILDCVHLNQTNCAHSEDAGVRCQASNTSCLEGDVRLVNGQNQFEGRVEICLNGEWGTVCHDYWSFYDAIVVCRQLGYRTDGATTFTYAYFGQGTGPIQLDNVGCSGTESALLQCNHITNHNCGHYEDAGVRCNPPANNCTENDLRLVGGQSPSEGRVEICLEGQWGTVCDTYWGSADAQVACRQLGYVSTGAASFINAHYGQGTGLVHLNYVQCSGSEQSLFQCPHNLIISCSHSEDAGIRCPESCSSEGAVRLASGQSNGEGRVEVCLGGAWGTICDNTWDTTDAGVVCRQLGYPSVGATPISNAQYFGQGFGPVNIQSTACSGNEVNILSCTYMSPSHCYHSDDSGVRCTESCTTDGEVRLIGGQDDLQGTIQICIAGVWGSVCDDLWGTVDANVICNQLGHSPYNAVSYSNAYYKFGPSGGPIHITNVGCVGNESNVLDCPHSSTPPASCDHNDDAGVQCQEKCDIEAQVRLVNGESMLEGRVEVCHGGSWATICDSFWSSADARVVCQQLGYSSEGALAFHDAYFGQGSNIIFQLGNFLCNGNENNILECLHFTDTCAHTNDAGVRCRNKTAICTEAELRLVGGSDQYQGRVEVCSSTGVWGTVCDDYWDTYDARVVCRQIGFSAIGAVARYSAFYGQGTGPILYDNVACNGNENILQECSHTNLHNCGHYEDAGVSCQGLDNCTTGQIRLVGETNPRLGRVEICIDGQWGTICDNSWTASDADVVCRHLGYYSEGAIPRVGAYFGQGTNSIHFDSLACNGNESSVLQCSFSGGTACTHSMDVGVHCPEGCSNNGSVRIIGGEVDREGTVEVCQNGVWSPVCDDQWDISEVAVVCRQLGFPFDIITYDSTKTIELTNYGREFYVGFMQNYQSGTTDYLLLLVQAERNSQVEFHVETVNGLIYTGTTTNASPVTVSLPVSLVAGSASYTHRNKGIRVYTTGGGFISVVAVNYDSGTVGEYLAYPCIDSYQETYEYFVVSTGTLASSDSEFLLVGCEDDTSITVTPSQSVYIPVDAQSSTSSYTTVSSGANHQISLDKMQTFLITRRLDLTGTRIVSNKPLTVISGHMCGNVPTSQKYCEHLAEQIPPTSTWGQQFLLVPFGGRNVGQYHKIVASRSSTTVIRTCNSVTTTQTLSSAGSSITFFTTSSNYCFVESNKPVMVSQLGIGGGQDSVGDPIITIVPSLDQYTDRYTFSSFNTTQFDIHQISVSVLSEYYQPNSIRLDGLPINASWTAIYNGGTVVGYGCHISVAGGVTHTVSHDDSQGKLSVQVYGWSSGVERAYGYVAGMKFSVTQLAQLSFSSSRYGSGSGEVFGSVQCVGNESSLLDCSLNTSYVCDVDSQAGVLCPVPVVITQHPANLVVNRSSVARFFCTAFGLPSPQIEWYKQLPNGSLELLPLTSNFSVSVSGAENRTSELSFLNAAVSDAGSYLCQATSAGVTNATSSAANFTVIDYCTVVDAVRLVNGTNEAEGRVEICSDGVWNTFCDSHWNSANAEVVCRQLGYAISGAQAIGGSHFGRGNGPIHLTNVQCNNTEDMLQNCPYFSGSGNCSHNNVAGVICSGVCEKGSVRLAGGMTGIEGRVEVCVSGPIWSTVCDDYWGALDAQVVCKQLGYSEGESLAFSTAYFGQGTGLILLENVHCNGSESFLLDCNYLNQSTCAHSSDAGVRCQVSNTSCLEGDVRLVNGQNQYEGRVEICLNSVWGTVCDDYWSSTDARVVCKQLGYGTSSVQAYSSAYFGQGTGPIQLDNVGCSGTESTLLQCSHLTIINNCVHAEDAGVRCSQPDGCTDGNVRLVGGQSPIEGRVEICLEGQWGTVCDDYWGSDDTRVACRQLGYAPAGATFSYAYFGQGSGPIHLNNVHCNGDEISLLQCPHNTITYNYCGHYEDVGIRCQENCTVEGAVRLTNGQSNNEGRVEYCSNKVWGTVCDNSWGNTDAGVVCRQLGYPSVGAAPLYSAPFGQGAGPIYIKSISCTGNENNINNCTIGTSYNYCSHYDDAGLRCGEFCTSEGEVRLIGGETSLQGTVQICIGGVWGSVCDSGWGTMDAIVVCNQLDNTTIDAIAYSNAHFGATTGPVHIQNVQCFGNESRLEDCSNMTSSCSHSYDAGVACLVKCSNEGQLRLVGGNNTREGRVEVCFGETWATICDAFWSTADANVVCQQLGYSSNGALAFTGAYFGQGIGHHQVGSFLCNGTESHLLQCLHSTMKCAHSNDAGVRCSADNAATCTESQLRLAGGSTSYEGRVEVCSSSGAWSTVCGNFWDVNDATVVCRQLGFSARGAAAYSYALFGQGTGPILYNSVHCTGNENVLQECSHTTSYYYCSHYNDAGVSCQPLGNCTTGEIRLAGGTNPSVGRVEICIDGQWGTICDNSWTASDAAVVCRQMGFPSSGVIPRVDAYYGEGTLTIQFDNLTCSGTESSVLQCSFTAGTSCSHNLDVGVQCPESCGNEGSVRLLGGDSDREGTVEVCQDGVWGLVCDDQWDIEDAAVVCRQLGYPFDVNSYQINETTSGIPSNYGEEFYIGFMRNLFYFSGIDLRIVVQAETETPVPFGVTTTNGGVYQGIATSTNPVTVHLPNDIYTTSTNSRDNGVHVYSIGGGKLSVLAINLAIYYNERSVGEYLAYPCHGAGEELYEYYVSSIENIYNNYFNSEFLLVGCEENTSITITPSKSVQLPVDFQNYSKLEVTTIESMKDFQVTMNKMQTLLVTSSLDLTGTKIVSNKPLTVISGHECASVGGISFSCEHLAEQMPSLSTWGRKFLLVPFGGRNSGQFYKIIAAQGGTTVVRTCNAIYTDTLSPGNSLYFHTNSEEYCSVMSNKAILVTQLGRGGDVDGNGDSVVSIVPPLIQYTDRYSFTSRNTSNFNIHQVSVSILPEYYQPNSIRLDGHPIQSNWTAIYNSGGTVVGYGCHMSVTGGVTHTVSHDNPSGKLAVLVYGWNTVARSGYSYPAGLSFKSLQSGDQVALSDSYFGPGSGPVQFGDVQCLGNESSLTSCQYATSQCTLGSQAGVICPDVSLSITSSGETVVGSMLILTCKYSGELANSLLLRWTSPNGDIISNTTDFTQLEDGRVASSLPLQFDSLVISDGGQYTCDAVIQTGMSTIETSSRIYGLTLKVPSPKVSVFEESMSDVIFEGQQLILVCSVAVSDAVDTNSINLTVLWSGPDAPVSVTPATKISSTNYESRLVISELVPDRDNGSTYTCTAKLSSVTDQVHILSSSNSDHYNIIIDVLKDSPSSVNLFPIYTNLSLNENGALYLSCSSYGYPPPTVYWQRGTTVLVNAAKFQIMVTSSSYEGYQTVVNSTLRITGLLPSDEGQYVCTASNERGTNKAEMSLNVIPYNDCLVAGTSSPPCGLNGACIDGINTFTCNCEEGYSGTPCEPVVVNVNPVVITTPPKSVKAELYHQVSLTCEAMGDLPITYQWQRDEQVLLGETSFSLVILEVSPEDRGAYTCTATNHVNNVTSEPAIVSIRGVHQYVVDASLLQVSLTDALLQSLLGPVQNYNVTIIAVAIHSEPKRVQRAATENATQILITIWNNDMNVNSSNIRQILQESFRSRPSLSALRVVGADIFDACPSQSVPLIPGSNITVNWRETEISVLAAEPCPCQSLIKKYGTTITRHCGGSYSQGGLWENMDYSRCGLTSRTIELCEALQKPPEILSEILVEVTSAPSTLVANEVTAAATVIDQLTTSATKDPQVRSNYLESIDNVIEVDQEIIRQANASTSILTSLSSFSDNVVVTPSKEKQTFTRKNFAVQIDEVDPAAFVGESLNVVLGSVEEAMNSSGNIDPQALMTSLGLNPISNATGSLTVSETILTGSSEARVRISYSVFVSVSLFPTDSANTTVASIVLNVRVSQYNISTNERTDDLFNVTFQAADPPENMTIANETCADWNITGGFGRWTSDHCQLVSKPGERPVMCSCSQPAHFGLLFDLVPSPPLFPEALSVVTYLGLTLSIISLLAILITYLVSKEFRSQPHDQIIINLSLSLLGLYVFFLISGHVTSVPALCGISAGLLHYFMLVFFSWTAVESVFLFMKLVKVVGGGIPRYTLKAGIIAWTIPAVIVIIVGGAGHEYYTNQFFCRAEGIPFYIGTILPIVLIFIFNWIMYIYIIVSVFRRLRGASKSSNAQLSYRKLAWTAAVLSVVFGLGWCFGLAQTSVPEDSGDAGRGTLFALQFLFSLLVGSQGVLMFIFYGLANKKARNLWKKWFIPRKYRGKFSLEHSSTGHSSTMRGYKGGKSVYSNMSTMQRSTIDKKVMFKEETKESSFVKEEAELEKTDSLFDQDPKSEKYDNLYSHEPKLETSDIGLSDESEYECAELGTAANHTAVSMDPPPEYETLDGCFNKPEKVDDHLRDREPEYEEVDRQLDDSKPELVKPECQSEPGLNKDDSACSGAAAEGNSKEVKKTKKGDFSALVLKNGNTEETIYEDMS